jgi:hypothetical protein
MPANQLPASIRALKARLKILQRPTVWGSASVLLVAIVLLAKTWNPPQQFAAPEPPEDGFAITNPDSIDPESENTPTRLTPLDPFSASDEPLFGGGAEDVQTSDAPQLPFPTSSSTESAGGDSMVSPLLLPSRSSASRRSSSPSLPDPFASIRSNNGAAGTGSSQAGEASQNPFNRSRNDSDSSSTLQSPFSANEQPVPSRANPLQSALDRQAAPTSTQPSFAQPSSSTQSGSPSLGENSAPITGPVTGGTTGGMSGTPALQPSTPALSGQSTFVQPQPLPGQPSYGQTQPQPQFVPQTSPAPGSTGYTVPPAFRTNANTPAGRSFGPTPGTSYNPASGSGVPVTGFSSTPQPGAYSPIGQPQSNQPQPQTSPAPFSVPRTAPGQSIGGGQINTFSNP